MSDVALTYTEDLCHFTVAFAHEAGCPVDKDFDFVVDQVTEVADAGLGWLNENNWALGVVYLVTGPMVALFGAHWFP